MSHAFFITASYALVVIGFGALVVDAARRHAAAKRLLAELDPRGDRPGPAKSAGFIFCCSAGLGLAAPPR
jgi:heme exporter protein CcmD